MGNNEKVHSKRNSKNTAQSPLLGSRAVSVARAALEELGEGGVGHHIGVGHLGRNVATHRFAAEVPGYTGWEWNAVVACAQGSRYITVSELALVPGGQALQAPEWVPYQERVLPGDLGPTDFLPPRKDDPRLTDDAERAVLDRGTARKLTAAGLDQAKDRWLHGEFGPRSEFAEHAPNHCRTCAFFVPFGKPLGEGFGACVNEYSADGQVVADSYGCGAHSDTPPEEPLGQVGAVAFDDEKPVDF